MSQDRKKTQETISEQNWIWAGWLFS